MTSAPPRCVSLSIVGCFLARLVGGGAGALHGGVRGRVTCWERLPPGLVNQCVIVVQATACGRMLLAEVPLAVLVVQELGTAFGTGEAFAGDGAPPLTARGR